MGDVLAEGILRKIIRGDTYGQAYFDIEDGVVDAHIPDFTDEEKAYLHRLKAEVDPDTGWCSCDGPGGIESCLGARSRRTRHLTLGRDDAPDRSRGHDVAQLR